jgi:hypothetical protein
MQKASMSSTKFVAWSERKIAKRKIAHDGIGRDDDMGLFWILILIALILAIIALIKYLFQ